MNSGKKNKQKASWNVSFSGIFITLVMVIVSISSIISILLFVQIYRNTMKENAITSSEQTSVQVVNTVEYYTGGMQNVMQIICENLIKEDAQSNEFIEDLVNARNDIVAVTIYDQTGTVQQCWTSGLTLKDNNSVQLSYIKEDIRRGEIHITDPHVSSMFADYYPWVVTLSKNIQDAQGRDIQVAVDIRFSGIANYIDDVGIGQHGYCYIIDTDGNIIYHPQQQLIYSGLKEESYLNLEQGTHVEDNAIYTVKKISNYNWNVVGVSYVDEMVTSKVQDAVSKLLIILTGILASTFLIGWVVSKIFANPVHELVKAMRRFERDAENYSFDEISGTTEIKTLSRSFEHMVLKIQELMDKVRQEEITLRKTELKALQAQINPHFLYNTLDAIAWMCEEGNTHDAEEMVTSLASLFRISISRGHELIPIEKEIEHAKSYLKIEKFRYKDQFTYQFEVEESCYPYFCNKITLQPIIENAIYHGVNQMVDQGEISIRIYEDGKDIVFEVEDNGVGMTEEQCSEILHKENSDRAGIGIKNVNDRIKIYFGEEYGLSITSELDEGTCVKIRMPKIGDKDYERQA